MQHSPSISIQQNQPKLLDRVRDALRMKHYSLRTEASYINWIKQFIFFHDKKHPIDLVEAEINYFLTHLAVQKKVSASTQNQALCAIDFHYNQIFVRDAKGDKDRVTMLPEKVKEKLKDHLKRVKKLHEKDLETGYDIRTVQLKSLLNRVHG